MISEFMCIVEDGSPLLHLTLPVNRMAVSTPMQANLISALFTFTREAKKDSLRCIQMYHEQMLFQTSDGLIFVLVVDAQVRQEWCSSEMAQLVVEFKREFPDTPWEEAPVVDLAKFESFKTFVKTRLEILERRLHLLLLLLEEHFLTEIEAIDHSTDLKYLGELIAQRVIQRFQYRIHTMKHDSRKQYKLIRNILDRLEGAHIIKEMELYQLHCEECQLCTTPSRCFYEALLNSFVTILNLEASVKIIPVINPVELITIPEKGNYPH